MDSDDIIIGIEMNENSQIIHLIVYVNDESSAQLLTDKVNECGDFLIWSPEHQTQYDKRFNNDVTIVTFFIEQ